MKYSTTANNSDTQIFETYCDSIGNFFSKVRAVNPEYKLTFFDKFVAKLEAKVFKWKIKLSCLI